MATVVDSYSETNSNAFYALYSGNLTGLGQSITVSTYATLTTVQFYLAKVGSPTGNVVAKLYHYSGTPGSTAIPSGAAVATSDNFNIASLTTTLTLTTFTFSGANLINLSDSSGHYITTVEYSGGNGTNYLRVGYDSSSTHSGNQVSQFSGDWTAPSGAATIFYVYGNQMVGPDGSTTQKPVVLTHNGTDFYGTVPQVHNGTSFVVPKPKIYDGSAWQEVSL